MLWEYASSEHWRPFKYRNKRSSLYSAYRKDEIEGKSLIQMRSANCDPEALCIMKDWNDGICNLNIDLNKIKFEHNKIKLNQYGNGMCEL